MIQREGVRSTSLAVTQQQQAVSHAQSAQNERDIAWLATLAECVYRDASGTQVQGWRYRNRYGVESCELDPVKKRNDELRSVLRIAPILNSAPTRWVDGQWIKGKPSTPASINPTYISLLLGAQANPAGQEKASLAGVSWKLSTKTGEPFLADTPLTREEILLALSKMLKDFGAGSGGIGIIAGSSGSGKWYKEVKKASTSKEDEQKLRLHVAKVAKAYADVASIKRQTTDADNFFCSQTMGLSTELLPCCLKFVADVKPGSPHDKRYEKYAKRFAEQDPSVMTCLHNAKQAALLEEGAESAQKHKRLIIMAAGAVGVVVLGAALLTRGKKE